MMRTEAEREFAKTRLRSLTIDVYAQTAPETDEDEPTSCNIAIQNLLAVNDSRATFQIRFSHGGLFRGSHPLNAAELHFIDKIKRTVISNSDLDYQLRVRWEPEPFQKTSIRNTVRLGVYHNQTPIPNVDLNTDDKTVSFEWKPVLKDLFGHLGYSNKGIMEAAETEFWQYFSFTGSIAAAEGHFVRNFEHGKQMLIG